MTTLVLHPGQHSLGYAFVSLADRRPIRRFNIRDCRGAGSTDDGVRRALRRIARSLARITTDSQPAAIAVHVAFGGELFDGPVLCATGEPCATGGLPASVFPGDAPTFGRAAKQDGAAPAHHASVIARLEQLVPAAPLHLPLVLSVIRQCEHVFPASPIVLAFDTAFFVALPERESHYALDEFTTAEPALSARRFGYHGLFHQAACAEAAYRLRKEMPNAECQMPNADCQGQNQPLRILSICLEPRPEIAAVIGGRAGCPGCPTRPVMVSGGVTPLEGLPGETTCGEMDPGIILDLARRKHWGPEQIDRVLTRRSGLFGLTGRRATLAEVLRSRGQHFRLARDVIRYRMMMLAGGGVAAMGGLDAIVFSGRYAPLGRLLGPWLASRLTFTGGLNGAAIRLYCCKAPLDRLLAEAAMTRAESASTPTPAAVPV